MSQNISTALYFYITIAQGYTVFEYVQGGLMPTFRFRYRELSSDRVTYWLEFLLKTEAGCEFQPASNQP